MKVLFLEDVEGVAHGGDIKEVKRGFAKNYLLPKNIAILATKASLERIPKLKTEVQDHKHIIPEDSKEDWVRGGLPTRQMIRNEDYLRRCQEKTLE